MPFRQFTDLDSTALNVMQAAYDEACRILDIKSGDARSSALAVAIATAARSGERDAKKLRECGVSACSNPKQT
jgi:hypothetical protein